MSDDENRRFDRRWTRIVGGAAIVAIVPGAIQALYNKWGYDLSARSPGANVKIDSVELGEKTLDALRGNAVRSLQPAAVPAQIGYTIKGAVTRRLATGGIGDGTEIPTVVAAKRHGQDKPVQPEVPTVSTITGGTASEQRQGSGFTSLPVD